MYACMYICTYVHNTKDSLALNLKIGKIYWRSTVIANIRDSALNLAVSQMADPTQFWSAIFMFCSENGRWQVAIFSPAHSHKHTHTHTHTLTQTQTHTHTHTHTHTQTHTHAQQCWDPHLHNDFLHRTQHIHRYKTFC